MSDMIAYAVYDIRSEVYSHPMFCVNEAIAIRNFIGSISNPQSSISMFPEDFALYRIGRYNESSGIFTDEPKLLITSAKDALNAYQKGNDNGTDSPSQTQPA